MRYIDSEKVYEFAKEQQVKETGAFSKGLNKGLQIMMSAARNRDAIPAADVVPVVRCRDCYFRELDGADVPVCTGAMAYSYTPDDWYCAGGERKDGGQEEC